LLQQLAESGILRLQRVPFEFRQVADPPLYRECARNIDPDEAARSVGTSGTHLFKVSTPIVPASLLMLKASKAKLDARIKVTRQFVRLNTYDQQRGERDADDIFPSSTSLEKLRLKRAVFAENAMVTALYAICIFLD
jgi:hypothetical protein